MKKISKIVGVITALAAVVGGIAFIAERFEKKNPKNSHKPFGIYEKYIKRPLDAFLATGALIVLSPVLCITAIMVRVKLGSPVLFTQDRPGKDEKIFKLYKFRSMTDQRDENGNLLPDDVRLTKFGRVLRSTSLDELPELWNVFIGDMSLIGPRPLATVYLPYYTEEEQHRHDIRPGLSGLAQVNGRNAISWEKKFEYDLYYVNNVSLSLDIKILFQTINKVFIREGIGQGELMPTPLDKARNNTIN